MRFGLASRRYRKSVEWKESPIPYRPLAEFDLRVAAVAVVSQARYSQIDPNDNLRGEPEVVIEIKPPSARTCFTRFGQRRLGILDR